MNKETALTRTMTTYSRTACATGLLPLLLLLTLPAAVEAQFTYTTNNGAITITRYTGPGGAVTIPYKITGMPVTSIGPSAFQFNSSLTSVARSEEHTSELQSLRHLVCRLL